MILEALQHLDKLSRKASGPRPVPEVPRKQVFIIGDELKEFPLETPCRGHEVATLESFARAVEAFADKATATIWVGNAGALCWLNGDGFRNDVVTLPVPLSHIFEAVERLPSVQPVEGSPSKGLLKYLAGKMYPIEIAPVGFVDSLRNVTMTKNDTVGANHQNARDEISRSVAASVTGADKIPEIVVFAFQAFPSIQAEVACKVAISCRVVVDAIERSITVTPLPGEMERTKREAQTALMKAIVARLEFLKDRTFCGER